MQISQRGIDLIKEYEGFSAAPYKDVAGYMTTGFGHLIKAGEVFGAISLVEAQVLLERDVAPAESCVNQHVSVPVTQEQFDALVSFVYNLGCSAFCGSTLLRKLNAGMYKEAAREFLRWDKAGGMEVKGLLIRRGKEMAMFLEGTDNA